MLVDLPFVPRNLATGYVSLLQKPFTAQELAARVHDVLTETPPKQARRSPAVNPSPGLA